MRVSLFLAVIFLNSCGLSVNPSSDSNVTSGETETEKTNYSGSSGTVNGDFETPLFELALSAKSMSIESQSNISSVESSLFLSESNGKANDHVKQEVKRVESQDELNEFIQLQEDIKKGKGNQNPNLEKYLKWDEWGKWVRWSQKSSKSPKMNNSLSKFDEVKDILLDIQKIQILDQAKSIAYEYTINKVVGINDISKLIDLPNLNLSSGSYSGFQFKLGSKSMVEIEIDGATKNEPLHIQSKGDIVTLHTPFKIETGHFYTAELEIDYYSSLKKRKNGSYYLKPVIRAERILSSPLTPKISCDQGTVQLIDSNGNVTEYSSLKDAIKRSNDGDIIEVSSATNDEPLIITKKNDLTITSSCGTVISAFMKIESSSNIVIDGFNFYGSRGEANLRIMGDDSSNEDIKIRNSYYYNSKSDGMLIENGNRNISISNSIFEGSKGNGLKIVGDLENLELVSNTFIGNGNSGLSFEGQLTGQFLGNLFTLNGQNSNKADGYGILSPDSIKPEDVVLIGNTFYMNKGEYADFTSTIDIRNYHTLLIDGVDRDNMSSFANEKSAVSPYRNDQLCTADIDQRIVDHNEHLTDVLFAVNSWFSSEDHLHSSATDGRESYLVLRPHTEGLYQLELNAESLKGDPNVVLEITHENGKDIVQLNINKEEKIVGDFSMGCGSFIKLYTQEPNTSIAFKALTLNKLETIDLITRTVNPEDGGAIKIPDEVEFSILPEGMGSEIVLSMNRVELGEIDFKLPPSMEQLGASYEMGPSGTVFNDQGAFISIFYDQQRLTERNARFEQLAIMTKDHETGDWIKLKTYADTVKGTVSAFVPHFSPLIVVIDWNPVIQECGQPRITNYSFPLDQVFIDITADCLENTAIARLTEMLNWEAGYSKDDPNEKVFFNPIIARLTDQGTIYAEVGGWAKRRGLNSFGATPWVRLGASLSVELSFEVDNWVIKNVLIDLDFDYEDNTSFFQIFLFIFDLLFETITSWGAIEIYQQVNESLFNKIIDAIIFQEIVVIPNLGVSLTIIEYYEWLFDDQLLGFEIFGKAQEIARLSNQQVDINSNRLRLSADFGWISDWLINGFRKALLDNFGVSLSYSETSEFIQVALLAQGMTPKEIGDLLQDYFITYGSLPTARQFVDLVTAQVAVNTFVEFENLGVKYHIALGNTYCLMTNERYYYYWGSPGYLESKAIPSVIFDGKTYTGECALPLVELNHAFRWDYDNYCQSSKTSSSGSRKSCHQTFCFEVKGPYGFIAEKTLDASGDGSEWACNVTETYDAENYLTKYCVEAYGRSKKGYNAARGWAHCKGSIFYYDAPEFKQ